MKRSLSIALSLGLLSAVAVFYLAHCGKNAGSGTTTTVASASEASGESLAGASNSSGGGNLALLDGVVAKSFLSTLASNSLLIADAIADSCPAIPGPGTLCPSSPANPTWTDCTSPTNANVTWNGGMSLSCSLVSSLWWVTSIVTDGTTRVGPTQTVTIKTTSATNYTGVAMLPPGTVETNCSPAAGSCSNQRQIILCGTEYVGTTNGSTTPIFDYTVATIPPGSTTCYSATDTSNNHGVTVTGTGVNRQIISGVISVYHNLKKITGNSQVMSPLTFSTGCCHPTAGQITTTFSDTTTETLTFLSTCGTGTLVDTSGNTTRPRYLNACYSAYLE